MTVSQTNTKIMKERSDENNVTTKQCKMPKTAFARNFEIGCKESRLVIKPNNEKVSALNSGKKSGSA